MAHDINYARYCGNLSAFTVSSSRNFFRVSFRSNHVLDGLGFRATYQFLNDSSSREKISDQNLAHIRSEYIKELNSCVDAFTLRMNEIEAPKTRGADRKNRVLSKTRDF